jgi:hypothetical protein
MKSTTSLNLNPRFLKLERNSNHKLKKNKKNGNTRLGQISGIRPNLTARYQPTNSRRAPCGPDVRVPPAIHRREATPAVDRALIPWSHRSVARPRPISPLHLYAGPAWRMLLHLHSNGVTQFLRGQRRRNRGPLRSAPMMHIGRRALSLRTAECLAPQHSAGAVYSIAVVEFRVC